MQPYDELILFRIQSLRQAPDIRHGSLAECRYIQNDLLIALRKMRIKRIYLSECLVPAVTLGNVQDVVDPRKSELDDLAPVDPERLRKVFRCDLARADDIVIASVHAHQHCCTLCGAVLASDRLPAELLDSTERVPHLYHLGLAPVRQHADRNAVRIEHYNIRPEHGSLLLCDRTEVTCSPAQSLVLGEQLGQRLNLQPASPELILEHRDIQRRLIALAAYYCNLAFFLFSLRFHLQSRHLPEL